MLSLAIDNTMELELTQLAQHKGKPLEQFLKEILLEYIEDANDADLGDSVMDDLKKGNSFTIPFSEIKEQLHVEN